jgi:hypothetical protein
LVWLSWCQEWIPGLTLGKGSATELYLNATSKGLGM